jgi:branched-chain amino acid aminotransferase
VTLPKFAFFDGQIVPYAEAKVGILTHTLNYGTGAFAGIRAYWNPEQEQLHIFRAADHYRRLKNSARLICAEIDYTEEELVEITVELLRREGYREDCYIRPLVYKSDEKIGVRLHDLHDALAIAAIPFELYIKNDEDARVTISSWRRIDDNAIPARGKICGAYVNSAMTKTDALRAGYDEALVLTQDGHVSEGSAMNVFIVRDGELITPPITDNILEGITRNTVIVVATEELGLRVVERPIDRTEIYLCQEVLLTGTAAQVTAVTWVDHRPVGDGVMGPVAAELRRMFKDLVRGRTPKYAGWLSPVYVKEQAGAAP